MIHRILAVLCLAVVGYLTSGTALANDEAKRPFDLPAGDADEALRSFSEQSGLQVIFPTDVTRDVRTRPVKGNFTPREAIDQMLAGTGLTAVQDAETKALTVRRSGQSTQQNKGAAAGRPPTASARAAPTSQTSEVPEPGLPDDVLLMNAFHVSTTVGSYHEETSSMATKVPTDLKEIASSLQILNANAINDRNAVTLQDVYSYIVGMTQSQTNGNGFSFRGFSNSGTFTQNIQFDGLQGATSSKGAVSAVNVDRVEFLKGPNSVLYGQMHPGGLLNVVTKSPMQTKQLTLSGTVSTFAGTYNRFGSANTYIGSLDLTGPIDKAKHLLYRVVVSGTDRHPFRLGDWEHDFYLYPSLTYQWSRETYLTAKAEIIDEHRRQDEGLVPVFTQGITFGKNARYVIPPFNVVYQEPTDSAGDVGKAYSAFFHSRFGDHWTLRIQERTTDHRDRVSTFSQKGQLVTVRTPLEGSTIARRTNNNINTHRYSYFDANAYGVLGNSGFQHTLIFGVGGGVEYFQSLAISNNATAPAVNVFNPVLGLNPIPVGGTNASPTQRLSSLGEYVSDMIRVGPRLHLALGTRRDQQVSHGFDPYNPVAAPYTHQFVAAQTSQAGLVYDVTSVVSAYASWSQSFVPNAVTVVDANGNSGFPPEKGQQYETGCKFETPDRNFFASLAAYYIKRVNVAVGTGARLPSGQAVSRLDGEQHSEGFEAESEWRPVPFWQIQAGVSISKAFIAASQKNPQTVGDYLANAPTETASLWTRYNVPNGPLRGAGVGLGIINQGSVWTGDPTTAFYFVVPGWTRIDADLYYKWRGYDIGLDVKNIAGRKYIIAATNAVQLIPGDPRKFTLTVTAHF